MTTDTPISIASVTKLYTATVVMRLYEQGARSLDDPMSHYLPNGLIRGIHVYRAMAAGLADRVWTLREVLMFRVPPWPQPQAL